jgi:hypothetical protein
VLVVQPFAILNHEIDLEAELEPAIEVDEMRVGVVQERALRHEPERHGETAAEWLDESPAAMRFPKRPNVRNLPAPATWS